MLDIRASRRGSRRRPEQVGYLPEMREPRRQEQLQALARRGAVTSKRSVQRDAIAKASSRSAFLCQHVGDEPVEALLDHFLMLFALLPPSPSFARVRQAQPDIHRVENCTLTKPPPRRAGRTFSVLEGWLLSFVANRALQRGPWIRSQGVLWKAADMRGVGSSARIWKTPSVLSAL